MFMYFNKPAECSARIEVLFPDEAEMRTEAEFININEHSSTFSTKYGDKRSFVKISPAGVMNRLQRQ